MARQSAHRVVFKLNRGGLHRWAQRHGWSGKESDPLPEKYKDMAAASDNPHTAKMGHFAKNFGGK